MSEEKNIQENEQQEEESMPEAMLFKQQLEEKDLKIREYEEMARRERAEAENIRKRMDRERKELLRSANKMLLTNFLDIVDDFERALSHTPEGDGKDFYTGVEMIYQRTMSFLESNGVNEIACLGEEFDPKIHEAIALEEDDKYSEEKVIEIYQKGYKMYDSLLRAPKVKIGKPAIKVEPKTEEESYEENEE